MISFTEKSNQKDYFETKNKHIPGGKVGLKDKWQLFSIEDL